MCTEYDAKGICIKFFPLIPKLLEIMSWSYNYTERLQAWKGFRDTTGPRVKPFFQRYVYVLNVGAHDHNWDDVGQSWRSDYELGEGEVVQMMKDLWRDLKPMYEEFHGYIR